MEALVKIKNLKTYFFTEEGVVSAVDGVDLDIHYGETLGLVGESGCGKTVMAKSILRLIPDPPGRIVAGEILFEGQDLLRLEAIRFRKEIRGNKISMLRHVGIPSQERMVHEYPHRYSGGMRQRAMIAMALACNPSLIMYPLTLIVEDSSQESLLGMEDIMRKRSGLHAFIFCVFLSCIPCLLFPFTHAQAAKYGGILKVGIKWDARRYLDPHSQKGYLVIWTTQQMYNYLARERNDGTIEPRLAESWECSDGGKTWIFHLRKGVK